MDQAIIGLGGALVACAASRLRFWTVAGEQKLIAGAGEASQSQAHHRKNMLGLAK